jgi:hypothetical protein
MEGTPIPTLLHEFHHHRLGATIEDVEYEDAEVDFSTTSSAASMPGRPRSTR